MGRKTLLSFWPAPQFISNSLGSTKWRRSPLLISGNAHPLKPLAEGFSVHPSKTIEAEMAGTQQKRIDLSSVKNRLDPPVRVTFVTQMSLKIEKPFPTPA
jgi:hypothetical protein